MEYIAKKALGSAACKLLQPNTTLALGSGSTVEAFISVMVAEDKIPSRIVVSVLCATVKSMVLIMPCT